MFVLVTLSIIGLPMLNSFVGEFLILSGSMQSTVTNHHLWTAVATSGVILSAAYMLRMIQRVFYCELGPKPQAVAGWDLDAREHLALWPVVALFLAMGLASPLWMRAIDTYGASAASAQVLNRIAIPLCDDTHPCRTILTATPAKEVR
jgi:NADH-quinone oxidoreductase subunit M